MSCWHRAVCLLALCAVLAGAMLLSGCGAPGAQYSVGSADRLRDACTNYRTGPYVIEIAESAVAYYKRGAALAKLGRYAEACEQYAKAVEAAPVYSEAHFAWGAALLHMRKAPEDSAKFARAVEINPRFADAWLNWGVALAKMGKRAEAEQKLSRAAELNPQLRPQIDRIRRELLGKE